MNTDRICRLVVRAYPADWCERHGADLVATLADRTPPGRRVPPIGDLLNVVGCGLRQRAKQAGPVFQIAAAVVLLGVLTAFVDTAITPTSASFLATSLLVIVVPGTGAIYSISTALTAGWQRGSIAALGCTFGIVPHLFAATIGLSGLMQASAQAFEIVRWLGVAYLAYLAIGMLRSRGQPAELDDNERSPSTTWATIRRAVLINLLNPKLTIFFFAFLPQFLDTPPALGDVRLIGLSAVFMAMTFAVFLIYVAIAARLRTQVLERPSLLQRIEQSLGLLLAGFAVRLAISER